MLLTRCRCINLPLNPLYKIKASESAFRFIIIIIIRYGKIIIMINFIQIMIYIFNYLIKISEPDNSIIFKPTTMLIIISVL